jgi:hypothetical protein
MRYVNNGTGSLEFNYQSSLSILDLSSDSSLKLPNISLKANYF